MLILLLVAALSPYLSAAETKKDNSNETPIGPKWWPSEWGPGDQRGAANRITPQKVKEGAALIKAGKIYQLGHVYERGMPLPAHRTFSLTIPGGPTSSPGEGSENMMIGHEEMFTGEIGQVGTQFDGFGHVGVRLPDGDYFYNGFKGSDVSGPYGLKNLGIEHSAPFFTRGILIDVAAYKNIERMKAGEVITPEDLQGALKKQGVAIREGDTVLLHTGHGQLWMKDNETYSAGEPGIGMKAAKWLTDQKISLIGADTWAIEVVPSENPKRAFEVHQWNIVRNGLNQLENLDLTELARDKVYEFAFVFCPLRFKGATGSPGNPIAIR
jgi:kynurenine formamidase